MEPNRLAWAVMLTLAHGLPAQAADKELNEMLVKGEKSPLPANLPAAAEGVTAKQIDESINALTSAETIKYLPSIVVRERYVGDRNGIVSTRTAGTLASAQSLVYADDMLLSNLLGNSYSYPPRWGMVAPEEIARADVIYGPFSALYAGNSEGGIVHLTTRMPEKFEAHAAVQALQENFKLYGTRQTNNGNHASASIGDRIGAWSFWVSGDHLDTHAHPMSFGTATRKDANAGGTPVTGYFTDSDQSGVARIVAGAYSIDHSVQNNGKVKVAYDFSPTLRATYTLGLWRVDSDTTVDTYLRDAAGNPFYNSAAGSYVRINNQRYTVSGLNPGHAESEHWMQGFSLKSDTRGEWDWEATVGAYGYHKDISRTAANTGLDSGTNLAARPAGQVTFMDGTGWRNADLRGEWRPGGSIKSPHQVSFGYHYDRYMLASDTYNTADWLTGGPTTLSTASRGKTETQALYLQDAWRFQPAWRLVLGGRLEQWRAFGGENRSATAAQGYADREQTAFSPKLSLSFDASSDWLLRGSLGKAYRFPTVTELFQTTKVGGTTTLTNDPNLKPEQAWSGELTAERALANGLLRFSLFQEDKQDALYSQTDTTVSPNVTSIQNIDRIRTRGIETAWQTTDLWLRGLDLQGSVTYANSVILKDERSPAFVGNKQPRIPDWRAKLVATYHQNDKLSYTLAARYSGRQHISLDNRDVNPDTYGGASKFFMVDARVVYQVAKQWSASLGVDNLNNYKAYVAHPWPQRTFFAGLKFDY